MMNARLSDMRTLEAELNARFDHGDRHIERLRDTTAPRVFIISGPSGVGKDTVLEQLRLTYPDAVYVVTATSRPKRRGEIEGVHYHFIDREEFEQQVANGEFIENAVVYNNLYGVPRTPIVDGIAAGKDVIIKVDVKGAATLRQKISNTVSIFLAPESMRELLNRLRLRKTDDYDALKRRFTTASDELERVEEFDYVVFNESEALDAAVRQITNIIEAEKARVGPPVVTVE
ncbi:MAG TPA: guanylate kinase [Thermomicrobiales bacterium]|nr:guanylate kinase [Thermomicrobiales bacterium]